MDVRDKVRCPNLNLENFLIELIEFLIVPGNNCIYFHSGWSFCDRLSVTYFLEMSVKTFECLPLYFTNSVCQK